MLGSPNESADFFLFMCGLVAGALYLIAAIIAAAHWVFTHVTITIS